MVDVGRRNGGGAVQWGLGCVMDVKPCEGCRAARWRHGLGGGGARERMCTIEPKNVAISSGGLGRREPIAKISFACEWSLHLYRAEQHHITTALQNCFLFVVAG